MSYYPALKQRLTCREVAPRYGLKVNASGMALCPFHDEHSPSLKLSRGFHCFGCGAQGDVITFAKQETRVEKVNANRTEVYTSPSTDRTAISAKGKTKGLDNSENVFSFL